MRQAASPATSTLRSQPSTRLQATRYRMCCISCWPLRRRAWTGWWGRGGTSTSVSHPFADQLSRDFGVLWYGDFQRAAGGVLVQPHGHPWLWGPSCDPLAEGRVCRLQRQRWPKPGGCPESAAIPPSPLCSLAFIPISPDLRLGWSSAPQLLHVQEPPVSAAQPLQPEGEKQPALPFTQLSSP